MAGSGRTSARSRVKSSTDGGDDQTFGNIKANPRLWTKNKSRHSCIRIFNVNLKALLGFGIFTFVMALFFINHLVQFHGGDDPMLRVITPFPAPKLTHLPMFQGAHKESLYWGTYRPNVYLGIRARVPQSLIAGMMWIGVKDGRYVFRHVCQDSDELKMYGWVNHNGRDYGHQVLVDQGMTLATSFFKSKVDDSGYGGDWVVRIDAQNDKSDNEEMLRDAHLFFYLADEGENALILGGGVMDIHETSILASGSRTDVGNWQLHLKSMDDIQVHYSGFKTSHVHNLSDLVQKEVAAQAKQFGRLQLPDSSNDSPNILVFQISAKIPFQIDIAFASGTSSDDSRVKERIRSITGTSLTSQLNEKQKEFDEKFRKFFNISGKLDSEFLEVGKAALGNLLGGIGYFYGQSKISLPKTTDHELGGSTLSYWPAELYTAVPSRPFFPRGFLWDEGFHQLLIWRWDVNISLDIVGHWLDLMNIDGWIPREQILGAEALSKVPAEYVAQHPTNGNPPTLFLVLRDLVCSMEKKFSDTQRKQISSFLDRAFIRLEAWFQWFNSTQSGKEKSSYFWHGRDNATTRELNPKTLSSGFDDYPRASHPSEEERHLDLRCWMLLASDCMHSISELLVRKGELGKDEYGLMSKLLSNFELLNEMHFDNFYGTYFDFGNHTEKVRLGWQVIEGNNNFLTRELVREVLEEPILRLVPHIGYVSLFPFIWKIIPPKSWILGKQLELISNRTTLWTEYGLRSLSKTSSIYMKRNTEHDPPYWRGPIWMNMNYLILSSLHHYSKENGPYRERAEIIYNDLRDNLIRNVVKNYRRTGYFWEQYDQKTGKGKGARVFTGWTSVVLLIMAEAFSEC